MARNVYDDEEFFAAYAQLRRSREGLDGAPEWASVRALVGDVAGLDVLDLGCGYGWFCRWARDAGAASVVGIDVSERMLARARELTDRGVEYRHEDLASADLGAGAWDLVHSSLALHYLADLDRVVRRVAAALRPGGRLVATTEHPIFSARSPGWTTTDDGGRAWAIADYLVEGDRVTDWLAPGVVKHHRTLGTLVTTLLEAGLRLDHLEEWCPSDEQVAARPELAHERHRPMFVIVAATGP